VEPVFPVPGWKFLRVPLLVLCWAFCLFALYDRWDHAWHEFDTKKFGDKYDRPDGNSGHTQIDFGGQWVMGRMIWEGHGRELYNRHRQHEVTRRGYPVEDEHPTSQESIVPIPYKVSGAAVTTERHDQAKLMSWLMGRDPRDEWLIFGKGIVVPLMRGSHGNPFADATLLTLSETLITPQVVKPLREPALGGALYPPIHGFFYAPLGAYSPQEGYRILQIVSLLACFLGGYAVTVISRGAIWWPLATSIILLLPGTRPGLDLGQNHLVSMAIVLVGWALFVRGYQIPAGIVWGLLAFKPVWAVALILVPMLMGRMRFFLAMASTGVTLILATLPFVGINTWRDWFNVGKLASGVYSTDQNWVRLSRDLAGVVRRLVVDTDIAPVPKSNAADLLGWLVPGLIILITAVIYLRRADRTRTTGIPAGFVLLAAYLGCYRFMYYDVTISFVALAALLAQPSEWFKQQAFVLQPDPTIAEPARRPLTVYLASMPLLILGAFLLLENWFLGAKVNLQLKIDSLSRKAVNAFGEMTDRVPTLEMVANYYYPIDTYLLLILWIWCAWRVWRDGEQA
jgi:hypothetical protein